jgi:hypothetical protein
MRALGAATAGRTFDKLRAGSHESRRTPALRDQIIRSATLRWD